MFVNKPAGQKFIHFACYDKTTIQRILNYGWIDALFQILI